VTRLAGGGGEADRQDGVKSDQGCWVRVTTRLVGPPYSLGGEGGRAAGPDKKENGSQEAEKGIGV